MNIIYLAISIVSIFLIFYIYHKLSNPVEPFIEKKEIKKNKKIILTISTKELENNLENSISSILDHHPGIIAFVDFYVISKNNIDAQVKEKYSYINFIETPDTVKNKAETLNLILDLIKPYTYWINWEDGWVCNRTFIFDLIQIMDNTKTTQLQFTKELNKTHLEEHIDMKFCHRMPNNNNYCFINYDLKEYPKINFEDKLENIIVRPLYSLYPSINRVKDYNFGKFLTNPEYSDVKFELEFGERWMRNKGVKAIFLEGSVIRK